MATAAVGVPATGGVTSPVFQPGKHQPAEAEIYIDYLPLTMRRGGHLVFAPTEAGKYPVLVFLHGTDLKNSDYSNLLEHIVSHGFIVVAPQLYAMTFTTDDSNDIDNTKKVTNWLADPETGLLQTLKNKLNTENNKPIFPGVEPDLTKLAMAGHSRGGHTAFATALGLGHAEPELKLSLSALIGVDPVAGLLDIQMEPKVLNYEPGSFNLNGMPVLVLGTGISPQNCAPACFNHVQFYNECNPPCYHFVVTKYGHLDMLDDGANDIVEQLMKCFCQSNKEDPKELARRTIGGLVVAFLRASLQGDDEDIDAIIKNPGLAPAQLNQPIEYEVDKELTGMI